jgi:hypothetical protein
MTDKESPALIVYAPDVGAIGAVAGATTFG